MKKHLVLVVAATAALFVVLGPGLAAGAETVPATGTTATIYIKGGESKGNPLRFVAPETVVQGDQLEIVNETDAKKVGPHTFSLVTKGSIPKTPPAQRNCFTPKHICMAIAKWHGVKGEGPPTINPAEAGPEGWSTMGSLTKKGDSWFTGHKLQASFSQQVSATAPQTIYFMCAIHPWMHGKITVLPAG